jgi:NADPH-dependent ferric siderophore reductase
MTEQVEDPNGVLAQDDHMRDMDRVRMEVRGIARPTPSVMRVTGRIPGADPVQWRVPNLAVRIEVETPATGRPVSRIYTIRSFDAGAGTVEIDFVLHEDDSPAMRWLHAAQPGDTVWLTGPRPHFVPPFSPGKRAALFADDTAIPAVHAILEAWPEGVPGAIWIDSGDRAAMEALPRVAGVDRHLMLRDPGCAAGTADRLFAAATALDAPLDWTIWAAGERDEMRRLRAHFRALNLPREALQVLGYWKRGTSSSELDRRRLASYEAALAKGLRMEDMIDSDEAV